MTQQEALICAVGHIEHMAKFLSNLQTGYSFESLGEDMPNIKAAIHPGPFLSDKPILMDAVLESMDHE